MTASTDYRHTEQVLRPSEQELLDAWRELVEANAEQMARLRETEPPVDYWADGYAGAMVNLDGSTGTDRGLAALARPADRWLDIGAGYGRTTLPLARHVSRITAVDPSPGLTMTIREHIARLNIDNVDVLEADAWPPGESPGVHDVCVAINTVNFVAKIGPFLDAMETHALRLCVIGATELGTAWQPVEPIFDELWGERFIRLPALRELLALLGAHRRRFDIETHDDMPAAMRGPQELDAAHARVRGHYLVRAGSSRDARLRELLQQHFSVGNGLVQLPLPPGNFAALISWESPGA